jgi:hypothetical protein
VLCIKNGSRGAADERARAEYPAEKAKYERSVKALAELRAFGSRVLQKRQTNEPVHKENQGAQTSEQHVKKRARVVIDLGDD